MCLRNAISQLDFMSIKLDEMSNHLSLKMGFIYKAGFQPFILLQNDITKSLWYGWKTILSKTDFSDGDCTVYNFTGLLNFGNCYAIHW